MDKEYISALEKLRMMEGKTKMRYGTGNSPIEQETEECRFCQGETSREKTEMIIVEESAGDTEGEKQNLTISLT